MSYVVSMSGLVKELCSIHEWTSQGVM